MSTVLNNSENKILRNSAGKILKQNYNVGLGFQGTAGSTTNSGIYVSAKLRNLTLTQYTVECMFKSGGNSSNGGIYSIKSATQTISLQTWNTGASPIGLFNNSTCVRSSAGFTNIFGSWYTNIFNGAYTSGNNLFYINGVSVTAGNSNDASLPPSGIITAVELNNIGTYYVSSPNRSFAKIFEFRLTSRVFNISEILYTTNNGSFNEPLSNLNMEIWWKGDYAEILDFSDAMDGSDMRIGIRDYSGNNRHGELKNLPAGTLAEKLAYANANLFVS